MQKNIFLFVIAVLISYNCLAQWNTNSTLNTLINTAAKSQQNIHAISDTKQGAILVWDDNRNNTTNATDIYAQRIKKDGTLKWTNGGVVVCNAMGIQKSNNITSGGVDGSSIITWEDARNGNYDIYAQKIDSVGNVLWGANGVVVCNKATNQKNPKIVSDNAGGAIIVWEDSANFYFDVYAQRVSSVGTVQWTSNGVAICTAPNQQANPTIETDGLGGAYIAWQDKRINADYDIYAQYINASGTTNWTANGIVVCNAGNTQNNPKIEPDGSNGVIIGWVDKRNGVDFNIYTQRFNSAGIAQWTANGAVVCSASNNQSALDMKYIGSAGLVFSWKDDRASTIQIYAQLVNLSGIAQFTANGIQLSTGFKSINPNGVSDLQGGAIITWQDSTALGWDIKSQKINASGVIQWLSGGQTISNATNDQIAPTLVNDGNGGAIYMWEDKRNGTDNEIYAHHLFHNGAETVGINELGVNDKLLSYVYPNPITNESEIKLPTELTNDSYKLSIYNTFGQLILNNTINPNSVFKLHSLHLPSGNYFYLINTSNHKISTGKFVSAN